ncbi:MAG: hypothetical protein WB792_15390, partial [Desulfobacterales bacterium]
HKKPDGDKQGDNNDRSQFLILIHFSHKTSLNPTKIVRFNFQSVATQLAAGKPRQSLNLGPGHFLPKS